MLASKNTERSIVDRVQNAENSIKELLERIRELAVNEPAAHATTLSTQNVEQRATDHTLEPTPANVVVIDHVMSRVAKLEQALVALSDRFDLQQASQLLDAQQSAGSEPREHAPELQTEYGLEPETEPERKRDWEPGTSTTQPVELATSEKLIERNDDILAELKKYRDQLQSQLGCIDALNSALRHQDAKVKVRSRHPRDDRSPLYHIADAI
jgi:hypothetical protein